MTETPETVPATPTKRRRPFAALKVDPKKAAAGAWIQHPDSADQLCVRRLWCPEHIRAMEQAIRDYEAQHGPDSAQTAEGQRHTQAVALASGVVVGWRIAGEPDRPYDSAEMAALLVEPGYDDLRPWLMVEASKRSHFRAGNVAGN